MRALIVAATAVTLVFCMAPIRPAQAADSAILRKDNDAGASSTVIKKNEPPVTAMPAPRDTDKPAGSPTGQKPQ